MSLTPEEQAALDYQAVQQNRVAFWRGLQAQLKAPSGPAAHQKKNWAPLTRTGYIPGEEE